MHTVSPEILINSFQVTRYHHGDAYEFVLNEHLQVVECVKVESLAKGIMQPIREAHINLDGLLFELNHVRVNPRVDNTLIINRLTSAFNDIGVNVFNQPRHHDMRVCFKPLGEISDCIRFYVSTKAKIVFLSPTQRSRLSCIKS